MTQLPAWAELSAQLGCTRWETSLAPASDERPYHANFEYYRGRLGQIALASAAITVSRAGANPPTVAELSGR